MTRAKWGGHDVDPRKEKRFFRRTYGSGLAVEDAYNLGVDDNVNRRNRLNPFPPGRRHNEYRRGRGAEILGITTEGE